MEVHYDPIGVTKSRICALLAQSEDVREAVNYKGLNKNESDDYDPEEPLSLIWNCIFPMIKDPDTIDTSDPQILIGVESSASASDPRTAWMNITIIIVLHNDDLRTNVRYTREDLMEEGKGVCAYTKADYIAHAIIRALTEAKDISWLGDMEYVGSTEGSTNHNTHYGRTIKFRVRDINIMHSENKGRY